AQQPALRQALTHADRAKLTHLLQKQLAGDQKNPILFLWAATRSGEIQAVAPPIVVPKITYQWRDWFNGKGDLEEDVRAEPIRKTYISQPFVSKAGNQALVIAIATPIRDPDDDQQIVGVLAASIRVQVFEKWTSRLNLDNHVAVILNERGHYLAHEA